MASHVSPSETRVKISITIGPSSGSMLHSGRGGKAREGWRAVDGSAIIGVTERGDSGENPRLFFLPRVRARVAWSTHGRRSPHSNSRRL